MHMNIVSQPKIASVLELNRHQKRHSCHHKRHRAALYRAWCAAREVIAGTMTKQTAALRFATTPAYVGGMIIIVQSENDELLDDVLGHEVGLLEAAASVKTRAALLAAYRAAYKVDDTGAIVDLAWIMAGDPAVRAIFNPPADHDENVGGAKAPVAVSGVADAAVDVPAPETLLQQLHQLQLRLEKAAAELSAPMVQEEEEESVADLLAEARASGDIATFLKKNGLTTLGGVFKDS
jgi:hypothetical protein